MSTRPSRSTSIPIPRSSAATSPSRNIESLISIPFAPPGRPRLPSAQPFPRRITHADGGHGHGVAAGVRGSTTNAAPSAVRSASRSLTYTSGITRRTSIQNISTFEPRIVRGGGESSRSVDAACLPSSSTSPSRTRRASGADARSPSIQRQPSAQQIHTPPTPASFPRPAYLEHSSLRHMLLTELPPALPPSRKIDAQDSHGSLSALSPPMDSDEESNVSPPPELPPAPPVPILSHDQIMRLPTRWNDQLRNASLTVSGDGRDLTYHGAPCSGEKDAAAARTYHPIPPACGIYYYEVEIISKGQKGHISIGFAARDVKLSRLPGWEANSWGYHGDDGCSFAAERNGTPYGPTYGTGDVIGCGIDFTIHRAFFTKNGTLIGPVFENIGKDIELYPSVGLRHTGEAVRVNFGHEPFKYDIDYHVQQSRNFTWTTILNTPINSSLLHRPFNNEHTNIGASSSGSTSKGATPLSEPQTKSAINKLVMSYLAHHGYAKTARAFQKQQRDLGNEATSILDETATKTEGSNDIEMDSTLAPKYDDIEGDIELRTRIVDSVASGDIDTALSETRKHHPTVLEAEEGLMLFKLRCRKFVELILDAAEMKKRMKSSGSRVTDARDGENISEVDGMDEDGMGMDVDDDALAISNGVRSPTTTPIRESLSPGAVSGAKSTTEQYEAALNQAISYGQSLSNDYKADTRPQVRTIFKQTFGIVAYDDPIEAGGVAAEVAGHEARVVLANELNQAILKSQGRPAHPPLETLYRQTAACVMQLGMLGVGAAAFADMPREFLDA